MNSNTSPTTALEAFNNLFPVPQVQRSFLSAMLESDSDEPISPGTLAPVQRFEAASDRTKTEFLRGVFHRELAHLENGPLTVHQRRYAKALCEEKLVLPAWKLHDVSTVHISAISIPIPWNEAAKQYGEFSASTQIHKFQHAQMWNQHVKACNDFRTAGRRSYVREGPINQ